jgi:hypothetical protein
MSEFVNRMAMQRQLLAVVNSRTWNENLFGLSRSAIARWQAANQILPGAVELTLVTSASRSLSLLATKSQDHIAGSYEHACNDARTATQELQLYFKCAMATD